jgi:hypothetical protein
MNGKLNMLDVKLKKKTLELQLYNKFNLEQTMVPLRNLSLNGNANDLIDTNDYTKYLASINPNSNLINSNSSLNNINNSNKK